MHRHYWILFGSLGQRSNNFNHYIEYLQLLKLLLSNPSEQKHSCGKKVTIHSANVGDARAVLSCQPTKYMKPTTASHDDLSPLRNHTPKSKRLRSQLVQTPKSFRLTYDHKSDDEDEIKRIEDAGGFLMKNRVLGIMAVARSLGDHGMKGMI